MSLRWLPNAVCIVRMALVVPLVVALLHREFAVALWLILVAGGSDALDGFLAKTFDWRTRLGSLLDPAADKLLVVSVFVTLTYLGVVPIGLTAIVVLRDVVIVLGAIAYQLFVEPVHGQPSSISKLNTACQLAFILFTMTNAAYAWPPEISLQLLGAAVVFTSIASGLNYVLRWSKRAWLVTHAER
ncbi:MAG TPA: CDP-alcohol phosphatidyltransferase family protein [Gammaproteobacteria bacterium]|nr:CDP-alcohol phosphatidyltransferase family protein [Gammaproteobacteria bacterium]